MDSTVSDGLYMKQEGPTIPSLWGNRRGICICAAFFSRPRPSSLPLQICPPGSPGQQAASQPKRPECLHCNRRLDAHGVAGEDKAHETGPWIVLPGVPICFAPAAVADAASRP